MNRRTERVVMRAPLVAILALLAGPALMSDGAGSAAAQEPADTLGCRCIGPDGERIENCTCLVRPDLEGFAQAWSFRFPNRARIGVTVSGEQDAASDRDGARVQEVLEGGPAAEAGVREGDIIVRVDGRSLFEPLEDQEVEERLDLDQSVPVQRLLAVLGEVEPGDELEIEYLREGQSRRSVLEAERNPARFGVFNFPGRKGRTYRFEPSPGEGIVEWFGPEGRGYLDVDTLRSGMGFFGPESLDYGLDSLRTRGEGFRELVVGRMDPCFSSGSGSRTYMLGGNCVDGLELTAVNPELGEYFGVDSGLLVTEVREESTLGLQPGDVLLAIDGRAVEDVAHARRILQSYRPDEDLTLRVVRQGETMEVMGRRR